MHEHLTLVTSNTGKAGQLSKYLGIPLKHHQLDLVEIQSLNLKEVVKHKVLEAYKKLERPVLVDDTSVVINALGRLPGPFIKWFKHALGDQEICNLANFYSDNTAVASVGIGFYDGKILKIFIGIVKGSIAKHPGGGERGFGWDIIFIPKGYNKTRSDLNETDYDLTSPRRIALEKLKHFFNSL